MLIYGLDVYRDYGCKINKDVNGGFGTVNDFSTSKRGRLLAKFQKKGVDFPPLYFMSSLSVLMKQGHECHYTRLVADVPETCDLVLISSSIVCCESELAAIRELASRSIPVLAIGPFATEVPSVYQEAGASVLSGEPDTHLNQNPGFIEQVLEGSVAGPQSFQHSVDLTCPLDELPLIRWELYLNNYKSSMVFLGPGTALPVFSSRGCPYSCYNYCTYPLQQGRKHRRLTPKQLVDRLQTYKEVYGASRFLFRDPVFTLDRKHVIEICQEILQRGLKIWWAAELHLKDLDEHLVKLMHLAGLRCVFVGIETINPESIKASKRFSLKKDQQEETIQLLESTGISVKGMFIFGMPHDNVENLQQTLAFAASLPATYLQFSVFTPYPGTPIYESYKQKITASKYEDFTQWDLVFEHGHLSPADVAKALDMAYKASYFSPNRFLKICSRLMSIQYESLKHRSKSKIKRTLHSYRAKVAA